MTFWVAALSRTSGDLPSALRTKLTTSLSRYPGDKIASYGGSGWMIAKVDVGAFGCDGAFTAPDGAVLAIAGEPLLAGPEYAACRNRADEGARLLEGLRAGRTDELLAATGTYCGAYYEPRDGTLSLIADRIGLRPIYYAESQNWFVAATALRVLEAAHLPDGIDEVGTYEVAAFSFPLGERTCYRNVRTIGAAQVVRLTREGRKAITYFRWDRRGEDAVGEDEAIARLVPVFDNAVARRLRGDRTVLAFLSGGLDSRCIVASLRKQGVDVHTINFAPAHSQDRVFGAMAAELLSCRHFQLEVPASRAGHSNRQGHLRRWVASVVTGRPRPERPGFVWSGDGGSVGMGHVYMDGKTVQCLERGDLDGGARSFLRFNHLPGASNAVMAAALRERSHEWHVESVKREIAAFDAPLRGRALFLFLLLNDQRRHLADHFEHIDLHRFEFQLPFFDSALLDEVVRLPVLPFLRHALYYRWMAALDPATTTVPWQAYPDHEPCPVPFAGTLRYQWRQDYFGAAEERRLSRKLGRDALMLLLRRPFPDQLIHRPRFALAVLTSLAGFNRYAHVTRVGAAFAKAWHNAQPTPSP